MCSHQAWVQLTGYSLEQGGDDLRLRVGFGMLWVLAVPRELCMRQPAHAVRLCVKPIHLQSNPAVA